jgi:WhiB family redox-sensing transcriptional regulator
MSAMSEIVLRRGGPLRDTEEDEDWHDQAECRGMDTELFFPKPGVIPHEAKAACARCTVRAECEEAGRTEKHGVWGGLTQREVRRQKAKRRMAERWGIFTFRDVGVESHTDLPPFTG